MLIHEKYTIPQYRIEHVCEVIYLDIPVALKKTSLTFFIRRSRGLTLGQSKATKKIKKLKNGGTDIDKPSCLQLNRSLPCG